MSDKSEEAIKNISFEREIVAISYDDIKVDKRSIKTVVNGKTLKNFPLVVKITAKRGTS